ncbi:MAG: hypothetical protein JWQ68_408 [Cryobacterium sp.]|jgi:hypothetical protein|nr:hypothetical protein [Cryobacterium sp.]
MAVTPRPAEPPEGAGLNVIRLDLALTRDEIRRTLAQLAAKFTPRFVLRDNPAALALFALAVLAVTGTVTATARDRSRRDVRDG